MVGFVLEILYPRKSWKLKVTTKFPNLEQIAPRNVIFVVPVESNSRRGVAKAVSTEQATACGGFFVQ